MALRYLKAETFAGDLREPGAFSGVLFGLAIVLLTDTDRGLPIYLSLCNLFILLVYLYHLSAVGHPRTPAVDTQFPAIALVGDKKWQAENFCRERQLRGVLAVFLRGSYCAGSRDQLHQMRALLPDLAQRDIGLILFGTQPEHKWPAQLIAAIYPGSGQDTGADSNVESGVGGGVRSDVGRSKKLVALQQLDVNGENTSAFVARSAAPLILRPWVRDAARPSAWLIDNEGFVLWRELSANYRVPASAGTLRAQLFRIDD
ncbi:hypothetical protein [Microbulbifer sp. YPW1]|uniref:hypothetical protein n=1 Tax=Microbulbifer sp. YPW1 TaxID=2745199 RepID=UPI001599FD9F|nr:hypothetical protein [Microbulbifer sp. YPW1]QKX17391.1 hypothetical protein HUW35_10515 [Microbulbifer sp. YPW1]